MAERYLIEDLLRDEAEKRGFSGDKKYHYAGAVAGKYVRKENQRSFPVLLMRVDSLDVSDNPAQYKPLFNFFWGVDSDIYGNTIPGHGTDFNDFWFPYPLEVGNNAMKMEACRTVEEARKYGGWVKNENDRETIRRGKW